MRGRIYILVIAILTCGGLMAQPRLATPEIYIGAHVGAMASSVIFEPEVSNMDIFKSPLSVNGGLIFRYAGHKVCAIQVEINYMQRGWREVGENIDYHRQLDYIEVPLLMHLYFGKQHFRGFFNLGPQIGYCFRDTEYGESGAKVGHQYAPIDHSFDWGAAGGLGMYYRTNKIGLFQLEARFNYSFGSIFNNKLTDHFEFANPIGLSLNFAYLWEIKK